MLRRAFCCFAVVLFTSTVLAEDKKAETPAEGLKAIIGYLEKDDLKGLFLHRYDELERFAKTDEEKDKITDEMAKKFAPQKAKLLESFKKAQGVEPTISEKAEQKIATYV